MVGKSRPPCQRSVQPSKVDQRGGAARAHQDMAVDHMYRSAVAGTIVPLRQSIPSTRHVGGRWEHRRQETSEDKKNNKTRWVRAGLNFSTGPSVSTTTVRRRLQVSIRTTIAHHSTLLAREHLRGWPPSLCPRSVHPYRTSSCTPGRGRSAAAPCMLDVARDTREIPLGSCLVG